MSKVTYCQSLKVKSLPTEIINYYNSIQKDYKQQLEFCIKNYDLGYTLINGEDEKLTIEPTTPKDSSLGDFLTILAKGGQKAQNCYGVFYNKYTPTNKPKANSKISFFVKGRGDSQPPMHLLSDEEFNKKIDEFPDITPKEWYNFRQRALQGHSVWNDIADIIGNPNKGAKRISKVKKYFPKTTRGDDYKYCTALMYMVTSSFSSWCECHKLHQEETAKLKETLSAKEAELGDTFQLLLTYSRSLDESGYGLTRNVMKALTRHLFKNTPYKEFYSLPIEEIKKDKYTQLRNTEEKILWKAYDALKLYWRLQNRKKYISFPRLNDYQIPFGMTGRGFPFTLKVTNNNLVVEIMGMSFQCLYSYYFDSLSVVKNKSGYKIKFRHKLKDRKKEVYGDWIEAQLNEVKLLKKNENYFVYLPYTIEHEDSNSEIEKFFRSADPAKIPCKDTIKAAGFDLGISTPLTVTSAILKQKEICGNVKALDYGCGNIIDIKIIEEDTSLSKKIQSFIPQMKRLISAIRSYKTSIRKNITLDDETSSWLKEELKGVKHGNVRHQLQIIMSSLNKQARVLHKLCAANGHKNLSECMQLLRLLNIERSLQSSWRNIHLKENGKCVYFRKSNDKRLNFRDFVSKKYASLIVKYCKEMKIEVVFIEDLDMDSDFDKSSQENSLTTLFAPGQLKKCIEEALHKVGIGCVYVPPRGTSRRDPVTGEIGYRDPYDKTKLYVKREEGLGQIHADLAASVNILLLGLSHSIVPHSIYKNNSDSSKGKRLSKFCKIVNTVLPKSPGRSYWIKDQWIPETEKLNRERRIKDLLLSGTEIQEFSLTPSSESIYKSFQLKR